MIFSESQTFPEDPVRILPKVPVRKEDFAFESIVYCHHLDEISRLIKIITQLVTTCEKIIFHQSLLSNSPASHPTHLHPSWFGGS